MRSLTAVALSACAFASPAEESAESTIREVRPGVFASGAITIMAADHAVLFPAEVNMAGGVIEYAIVHESGKVHERLLSTKVSPLDLNVALLLARPKTGGSHVRVMLKLSDDAPEMRIGKWIRRSDEDAAMSTGLWSYQGSRLEAGVFVVERDALVGNPREGRENDDIWEAAKGDVPKVGTPVEVVI